MDECTRHFPKSGKLIASPTSCPWCEIERLRSVLKNISTVRSLEHFPALTALAYCREKAIEALAASSVNAHSAPEQS